MPNYPRSSRARYFPNPVEFAASGVAVDVSNGNIRLADGGSIVTSNNGDLTLAPNGTGITKTSGFTTSQSLNAPADFGVAGKLEVNGVAFFDYREEHHDRIQVMDSGNLAFGDGADIVFNWDDTNGLIDCTTVGSLALPCVQTANLATLQTNNTVAFSVDEANSELDITVRQSDGTVVTGTVALA